MPEATVAVESTKRRTLDPEVRRREILLAAETVFAEKGFHSARISDIAARAGVAQGTIYRFFESKEELAVSLLEGGLGRLTALVDRAEEEARRADTPERALHLFVGHAAEFYARHRGELRALHSWSFDPSTPPEIRELDEDLTSALQRLVVKAGDSVKLGADVDVPRLILLLLYSLSAQLEDYQTAEPSGRLVSQLVLGAIFADPEAAQA